MAKQGVSPLKFLNRLTALSKERKKEFTINFQNYILGDMRQKHYLKTYNYNSVTELIYFPSQFLNAIEAVLQALLIHFYLTTSPCVHLDWK